MTDSKDKTVADDKSREPYRKPELKRWGTLRELTTGGGGTRTEPVTKRRTRF